MNNTFEKRVLRGDLNVDMGAGAKRARTGGLYRGSTKLSEAFIAGYRAFVFGGREVKFNNVGKCVHVAGGIEPFEHLTEAQKQEWRKGIEYARDEKSECMALCLSRTPVLKPSAYAAKIAQLKQLLKRKLKIYQMAKLLGVSPGWVSKHSKKLDAKNEKTF